ncbi:MAG: zinc-dependent metalloprotease [Saprospiraceae bacterium]|nr:zinc-dependent metalloprotease [Saprospiraceae bacterium]
MKKTICLLFAFGVMQLTVAQTAAPKIICGNELFNHWVANKYPSLQSAFHSTFETAKSAGYAAQNRSPLKVKVVVHVVWKTAAENLPDSVILDQIRVLNEDFNRMNPDTGNLRSIFTEAAGNVGIEFELAQIVRKQTTTLFELDLLGNSLLSELKNNNQGGSDAWNTDEYLNIWVCKIQPTTLFGIPIGQILGFAFPPNGLNNWPADSGAPSANEDGVVIDFRAFGSNNPNPLQNPAGGGNLPVRGRTPVHEVGHYFGLRHIWGDGGLLGPNDCTESDGVDDTPFANAQSEFDCDKTKNTCDVVETYYNQDMPDLVENFMDYSSELCQNMFTKGQADLMRNVLMGPRSGLLSETRVQNQSNETLRIVPNPTSGWVEISGISISNDMRLAMYQFDGKQVSVETRIQEHQFRLNLEGMPAGPYFVVVSSTNGLVYSGSLVKN